MTDRDSVGTRLALIPEDWPFQIGDRQEFDNLAVPATSFVFQEAGPVQGQEAPTDNCMAPDLPSPQDWVLTLEKDK